MKVLTSFCLNGVSIGANFYNLAKVCFKCLCLGVFCLAIVGCSQKKVFITTPDSQSGRYSTQEKTYTDGVVLFTSVKTHSAVRFEIAQEEINKTQNEPLAIYISAAIKADEKANTQDSKEKGEEFIFDVPSVFAFFESTPVKILSYEELKKSSLNYALAIESFGVTSPRESLSGRAYPYASHPSFIYRGHPGFFFYDPWFSARDRIEQEQRLEERRRIKSIILSSYLRKNTLRANGQAKGGFIVIPPKFVKAGVLRIEVRILDEIHTLSLSVSKKKP